MFCPYQIENEGYRYAKKDFFVLCVFGNPPFLLWRLTSWANKISPFLTGVLIFVVLPVYNPGGLAKSSSFSCQISQIFIYRQCVFEAKKILIRTVELVHCTNDIPLFEKSNRLSIRNVDRRMTDTIICRAAALRRKKGI